MNKINLHEVFDALNYRYSVDGESSISASEHSLLIAKLSSESWKSLDSLKKQEKRKREWIRSKHDLHSQVGSHYFETLICVNDFIIDIIEEIKKKFKDDQAIKNAELAHLRICAILQIEKDHMDEYLIPKHHIQPHFISTLAEEYHDTYPDLNLIELSKAYTEMYELWPEKPDYNRKPS